MRKFISGLLVCLCAFPLIASAQNPLPQPPPQGQKQREDEILRVNTELVQTGVAVVDKQGRFVDGLQREQFELRVDGQLVPVSFAERVSVQANAVADLMACLVRLRAAERGVSAGQLATRGALEALAMHGEAAEAQCAGRLCMEDRRRDAGDDGDLYAARG